MSNFVIGFSTIDSVDGANEIARAFVSEGIAACVNIIPHLQSIYKWKGEVCAETELLMIIKTRKENIDKIKERLTELHPYDVPELIFTDIKDGLSSYLDWIETNS